MKNNLLQYAVLLLLLTAIMPAHAQVIARLNVYSGAYKRVNAPLHLPVSYYLISGGDSLQLFETTGSRRRPVPFQNYQNKYLYWILDSITPPNVIRRYELVKGAPVRPAAEMQVEDVAGTLLLREGSRKLLQYNYDIVEPPAGIDKVYRRSGFIHPLWAPDGQVITNIHPEGHWHHVGIWNPWTHTSFKGNETDFWNLQKKEGTVRFKGLISRTTGPVLCGFEALQDHIAFSGGKETVALNETWEVKAFNSGTDSTRAVWDFFTAQNCADTAGITLLQYRYGGGFGLRTTAQWTAANSQMITSEGKTRKDADSTRARWIKITGRTDKGQAGILIMNHPFNFDYPQPVRVWPENSERGEIMMNFSPTKMRPMTMTYGKVYRMYYRVMVFNNDLTPQEAEDAWGAFVYPPAVSVSWISVPGR